MNFGYPSDPSNDRRQKLISALTGRGGSSTKTGAAPLFGGSGRGFAGGFDLPAAALPALSFNPFLAQSGHGIPNLAPPSQVTLPPQANAGGMGSGPQDAGAPDVAGPAGAPADNYPGVDPNSAYDPNQFTYTNTDSVFRNLLLSGGPSYTQSSLPIRGRLGYQ